MRPISFSILTCSNNFNINAISLAGIICALTYAYLSLHSQSYGDASLFDLYITSSIVCLASMATWLYSHIKKIPITLSTVIFWAVTFRIIGVTGYPILEDDFYRYLWDGYQMVISGSPYTHPPSYYFASEGIPLIFETILDGINYPDISTVYGPFCQWIFALSYLIAPGEIWPLQVILSLFDISLIYLLSRVAQAKYILLYAWNPLVIKEIAFSAHPDILGIFFMMAAIVLFRKHIYLTALCCALAVSSKVFAVVIVPILIGLHWRAWSLFIFTTLLISAPFINDFVSTASGLTSMAELWLFNAPIYFLLLNYFSVLNIKLILLMLFTAFWLVYVLGYFNFQHIKNIPRGDILFGLFLICIPALNPWYLLWALPFAVIYPTYAVWVSSIAILLAYVIGLNLATNQLSPYGQPLWAIGLEFSIIAVALIFDSLLRIKNKHLSKTNG